MKIITGLGNPGVRYAGTPHNIGFMAVDALAARLGGTFRKAARVRALTAECRYAGSPLLLVKPQTFMNLSGEAVGPLMRYYHVPPEAIVVILDDADLEPGRIRIRPHGSSGGHRGLESVIAHAGTQAFPRVRLGIGRDAGDGLIGHVLRPFGRDGRQQAEAMAERAAEAVLVLLEQGVETAMNRFNPAPREQETQPEREKLD